MSGEWTAAVGTIARIILVEGVSDRLAVEALALRLGRDLAAEGVAVVAMGGATNVMRHLEFLGPQGLGVNVAGLVDEGEVRVFQRALERAGFGAELTRDDMERLGFYVCVSDLEEPEQRDRPDQARLRRFMGARGGRKHHYASVLVNALALDAVPAPLRKLLAHV